VLAADDVCGAGLLVQKLPAAGDAEEVAKVWECAQRGIGRLSAARLLREPAEQLLAQGFADHDLRLFRGAPVQFQCRCSQGRVAGLLRALGADEVREVLHEEGAVTVTCEFCHRPYRFDADDVEALFTGDAGPDDSTAIH
jgi:molecular chaperone Hsp33